MRKAKEPGIEDREDAAKLWATMVLRSQGIGSIVIDTIISGFDAAGFLGQRLCAGDLMANMDAFDVLEPR